MEPQFIIWVCIATIQIILFTTYLIKASQRKETVETEESIDVIPICNYEGMTYWLEGSTLYREPSGTMTLNALQAQKVDQLDSRDLSPAEVVYIIGLLKSNTA